MIHTCSVGSGRTKDEAEVRALKDIYAVAAPWREKAAVAQVQKRHQLQKVGGWGLSTLFLVSMGMLLNTFEFAMADMTTPQESFSLVGEVNVRFPLVEKFHELIRSLPSQELPHRIRKFVGDLWAENVEKKIYENSLIFRWSHKHTCTFFEIKCDF